MLPTVVSVSAFVCMVCLHACVVCGVCVGMCVCTCKIDYDDGSNRDNIVGTSVTWDPRT